MSIAGGSGIHSPEDRGKRAVLSSLGIHSLEHRSKRDIPSSLGTHSPAARTLDIRKQGVRTLGIRKKCPVGVEV